MNPTNSMMDQCLDCNAPLRKGEVCGCAMTTASTQQDEREAPELWCLYVEGMDEFHAMYDKADAEAQAAELTSWYATKEKHEHDPHLSWSVVPWPSDAASHARSLINQYREHIADLRRAAKRAAKAQQVPPDAGEVSDDDAWSIWCSVPLHKSTKAQAGAFARALLGAHPSPAGESDKRGERVWAFIEYVAKPLHKNGAILREQAQALLDARAAMSREQSQGGE